MRLSVAAPQDRTEDTPAAAVTVVAVAMGCSASPEM